MEKTCCDVPVESLPCEAGSAVGGGLKTVRLVPDGTTESTNGRFTVDAEAAALMIEAFDRQGNELVIDFEHQSLGGAYSAPHGRAPAAGWITKIWYEHDRGVFGFVRWNPKTRDAIREGTYGYLSPVLMIRKRDGKAIALHSAAITNTPAIPRMERLAASQTPEKTMNEETTAHTVDVGDIAELLGVELLPGGAATLVARCHEKLKGLLADDAVAIAQSVRETLKLPANANKDAIALALSVRSSGGAEATELAAMREAESQRVATEMVQGYIRTQQLNPNDKPAVAAATRLAMSDPGTLEAIFKNMPPQIPTGRTAAPTNRQMAIIRAEREFRENPGHQRATSLRAFVAQSLRDKGLEPLTSDETVTLSV